MPKSGHKRAWTIHRKLSKQAVLKQRSAGVFITRSSETPTSSLDDDERSKDDGTSTLLDDTEQSTWDRLAFDFQNRVLPKTFMAFGVKMPRVFTGSEIVSLLCDIAPTHMNFDAPMTRALGKAIAERLANSHWLFLPCSMQTRKTRASIEDLRKVARELKDEAPVLDKEELIKVFDDDTTLYRMTKDALICGDVSTKFFSDFVTLMKDSEKGVPLKEGKLIMRRITAKDGIFSKRTLGTWFETRFFVTDPDDFKLLKQLLVTRNVIRKLSFVRCFKFVKVKSVPTLESSQPQ